MTNVAIGDRWDLTKRTSFRLGFLTSQSPVADASIFEVVDLTGISTGVTLNWAHLSGTIGVVYESGNQEIVLSSSSLSSSVSGNLGISLFHLLWGLTYQL